MHHKRGRPKRFRAGGVCRRNKALKQNGEPTLSKVRGITCPLSASRVNLVAEGVIDYEDELEDIDADSVELADSCRYADYLDSLDA